MRRLRVWVGSRLESACGRIDLLPEWTWKVPLLHRLGCPRGLGLLAFSVYPPEHLEDLLISRDAFVSDEEDA